MKASFPERTHKRHCVRHGFVDTEIVVKMLQTLMHGIRRQFRRGNELTLQGRKTHHPLVSDVSVLISFMSYGRIRI